MFQFTHPGKGATSSDGLINVPTSVSIHAPWEGCDCDDERIHAKPEFQFTHPGKGATRPFGFSSAPRGCFNSRTLGRVRQYDLDYDVYDFQFQFTHPGKGATVCLTSASIGRSGFNSRTLGRVRPHSASVAASAHTFQFTHPGKGATAKCPFYSSKGIVSIHAPWEGCDSLMVCLS